MPWPSTKLRVVSPSLTSRLSVSMMTSQYDACRILLLNPYEYSWVSHIPNVIHYHPYQPLSRTRAPADIEALLCYQNVQLSGSSIPRRDSNRVPKDVGVEGPRAKDTP